MSCSTKIVQDIINSCQSVKGLKPFAYWAYRKDITFTYSDNEISAVDVLMLGTIQAIKFGLNAGAEEVSYEDNGNGFKHKFNAVINRTYIELDDADDIVVFVQTNSGVWLAYGAEHGLWKASQAKMSNDNLASIAVEFSSRVGMEETYSEYVVTADLSALNVITNFDTISGGTIANGGDVKLTIDTGKVGYIRLPNGTILTTVDGEIDTTYSGIGGAITYYVPKVLTGASLYGSGLYGSITTTITEDLSLSECNLSSIIANYLLHLGCVNNDLLTNLIAPKAISIVASGCALTAKSIGDILYAAYLANRANVVYNFSGGTNADDVDIWDYILTLNPSLSGFDTLGDWLDATLRLNGGDIAYN